MADVASYHKRAFGSWLQKSEEASAAEPCKTCLGNLPGIVLAGSGNLPRLPDAVIRLGVDDIDEIDASV